MDSAVAKDKRIKREIANSNERRRMQSINAGFQKLKRLLPVNDGEKISKANILQHAANYITSVERDRISMYEHNTLIRQILIDLKGGKIDIDSALSSIDSNATTLLSVPLNLQVTMASGSSTPASFPTPRTSPTTPTLASTVPTSATPKSATISQALFKVTTTPTSTTVTNSNNTSNNNNNNNSSENTTTKLTARSAQRTSKAPRRPSTRNNSNFKSTKNNNNNNSNTTATTTNNLIEEAAAAIGANSNIVNNNNIDSNPNIGSVTDIISDKIASPKNGLSTPGGATKAAIALPLEVPYTSEIVIGSHQNHHHHHHHHQQQTDTSSDLTGPRKLLKTGTTTSGAGIDTTDAAANSNQTLDTICKAIMVIEGDRAYKNEKP